MADFSKNCKLCLNKAMAQRRLFEKHLCNYNEVNCLYFNDYLGNCTEDLRHNYSVYHHGRFEGSTMAVSEEKACNNVRFANYGTIQDDGYWTAVCEDSDFKNQIIDEMTTKKCTRTKKYRYYLLMELGINGEGDQRQVSKFEIVYAYSKKNALKGHKDIWGSCSYYSWTYMWYVIDKFETEENAIAYLEQNEEKIRDKYYM